MEPVTVTSQMSFKQYYNVNLYMLIRKKFTWWVLVMAFVSLLFYISNPQGNDNSNCYYAVGFFAYMFLSPFWMYLSAKRLYRKIPTMGESKTYEFFSDEIKLIGETVKTEFLWRVVTKIVKRKRDFIIFTAAGRNFFFLPIEKFKSADDIESFKYLTMKNNIKNNFK
jgi:hypothetical protein